MHFRHLFGAFTNPRWFLIHWAALALASRAEPHPTSIRCRICEFCIFVVILGISFFAWICIFLDILCYFKLFLYFLVFSILHDFLVKTRKGTQKLLKITKNRSKNIACKLKWPQTLHLGVKWHAGLDFDIVILPNTLKQLNNLIVHFVFLYLFA